ncbi:hypothetical protein [Paenibacillus sp. JCM 10914]|uniref:hypothetical protein n=1 Tax=Paenibacillus sp. JCM 10914 TaxID=1236974 RepID=UPI0003CC82DB|nr:hypothetical protein [Paenibacillus sp. JCM 10914]GAE09520.1 hypothetical protein JCM10914_5882 [Paenibacillus sp. JCM 10914]
MYVDKIVNDIQTTLRTSTGELRTDIPGLELSSEGDKFLTRSLGAGGFQVQISSENGDITFNQSK